MQQCNNLMFFLPLECAKILDANVESIFEEKMVTKLDPPNEFKLLKEDGESGYDVWIE
jgi:hypothetical protein